MIYKFEFTNSTNEVLTLELTKPEEYGIAITKVTGLGPVNADINVMEISTLDGGFFNSARLPTRNIVFSLLYLWEGPGSIEEKRHFIYKYFSVKKNVKIKIFTDTRTLVTEGYVEKNEVEIFSEDEGSEISIICPDPYFYAADGNASVDFYSSIPNLTFLEKEDSVVGKGFHSNLIGSIVMGEALITTGSSVVNAGDAECGCYIKAYMVGPVSGIFVLYNQTQGSAFRLNLDAVSSMIPYGISAGDQIEITTIKGHKSVYLIRSGGRYNLLPALDRSSDWIQLAPGKNDIGYTVGSGSENVQLSMEYPITYEGV